MMKLMLVPLALALGAANTQAEPRSARLLDDAPKLLLGASPRLLDAALGATEVKDAATPGIGLGEHFGKTAAVGVVSSAAGVLIGAGLSSLSNAVVGAVIPLLLANLFLPPVLTVLVALLVGNWDSPGRFSFWLPLAGAFGVNAAVYLITSLALGIAVPWTNPVAVLLYSLVDGLFMGGATVGVMHLTEKKQTTLVTSFVPGVSDTLLVPLVKVSL